MRNQVRAMREKALEEEIEATKGKPHHWPGYFAYSLEDGHLKIELIGPQSGKKEVRGLDAWGLAVAVEARERKVGISTISFVVRKDVDVSRPDFEALRRRVSFLRINTNESVHFDLVYEGHPEFKQSLYSKDELFNRPPEEVVRDGVSKRSDRDKEGRLEKEFQQWLVGKGQDKPIEQRTNEHLAVLGEDFFQLKKKRLWIRREFPTGAFMGRVAKTNRILPTESVDIVTLNKHGVLSVIELKLDDSHLEVISQILDYSLYFRCYIDQLRNGGLKGLCHGGSTEIACYVVNNHFHPRFDGVAKYYSTCGNQYGFSIKKVVLGHATELGRS